MGAHGSGGGAGFGVGWPRDSFGDDEQVFTIVRLSEEHGFILCSNHDMALGMCVRVIPNHACPVANLARTLVVLDGDDVYEWPVEARGRVR